MVPFMTCWRQWCEREKIGGGGCSLRRPLHSLSLLLGTPPSAHCENSRNIPSYLWQVKEKWPLWSILDPSTSQRLSLQGKISARRLSGKGVTSMSDGSFQPSCLASGKFLLSRCHGFKEIKWECCNWVQSSTLYYFYYKVVESKEEKGTILWGKFSETSQPRNTGSLKDSQLVGRF